MYTVNHYLENLNDDNYTLEDTENLRGETSTEVVSDTIEYTGFTKPNKQTITINGDGSSVVNYYYTRNRYNVTLNKENGILSVVGAGTYKYGQTVTIDATIKEGYTFDNWTGDKPSSNKTYIFTMSTADVENTAHAKANTYTVVYDGNGATSGNTETSTHTYDEAKDLSANGYVREYTITYDYNYDGRDNTTKTVAYGFKGWNDDANGNGNVYNDEQSVINLVHTNNGSKTLYANWKSASDTNIPTRDGYKFTGWYTTENTTGDRVDRTGKYTPTADITLYAGWVIDDGSTKTLSYTVEYYKDNSIVAEDLR